MQQRNNPIEPTDPGLVPGSYRLRFTYRDGTTIDGAVMDYADAMAGGPSQLHRFREADGTDRFDPILVQAIKVTT